ncbi:phosphate/sulfate permease [Candidatus Methanoperedens nitroreducens]|uniref:Phosphate/sulfate permease n=1 Tax=Candidatus Methanoperedens nitratireducens TaxID=1392998 RepID=A0A062V6C7_9EURY|nr:inorganic phosphate transporter [Candidatus Methanoperedens nitroreducens]KCZ72143.1 phosphate/sulfate permease [Candidatus Methanoperedens nitroreducens]MDJ1421880.1 inorganic phosphate transporter [Candidatus Methanoperedens sp.]
MDIILIVAFLVAIFMGLNIGGNNAAASMGAAYGAKVRTKYQAVLLIGVFSLLGAVFSGGEVIKTLGTGILPEGTILLEGATVAVGAAGITLFLANILRIPVSTSQAAVGAVVGIGFFYGASQVNVPLLGKIVVWWIVTPVTAWLLAYLMGKYLYTDILVWIADHHESEAAIRRSLSVLLTISGCYVAYSAGANNAGNAVGPLVGAGAMLSLDGAILGGIAIGFGALLMGGRVLDTVGNEITELCVIRATFVEFISAIMVHAASIFGVPVSLGEIVAAGVIGIGCANSGMHIIRGEVVKKILIAWVVSPLLAGTVAYVLMRLI